MMILKVRAGEAKHTFATTGQSEGCQRADDAKDILRKERRDLALCGIGTMNRELRSGRGDDLLLLGPSKLTENGLGDRSRRLDRQGVHEHVRSSRHGERTRLSPSLDWWRGVVGGVLFTTRL